MPAKTNRQQKELIEKFALAKATEQFFGGITKQEAIEVFKVLSVLAQFPGANPPEPIKGCEVTWTSTMKVGDSLNEQAFNVQVTYKGLAFIYTTKGNQVIQLPDSSFMNLETWDRQAFLIAESMGLTQHLINNQYHKELQTAFLTPSSTELDVEKPLDTSNDDPCGKEASPPAPPEQVQQGGESSVNESQHKTKKPSKFKNSDFKVGQFVTLISNQVAKIGYVGYQPHKIRTDKKQYIRLDFAPPHPVFGSEYWLTIMEVKKYIKEIKEG